MADITNKTKEPKKLADLQEEIIVAQNKTISVLEDNVQLLREQIVSLKEKTIQYSVYKNGHQEEIVGIQN